MSDLDKLFFHLEDLLGRVDRLITAVAKTEGVDEHYRAYRWHGSKLEGISDFDRVDQAELLHLDRQINLLTRNTAQFIAGQPANNALLWGARGTGKSSLVKAQLTTFTG